VASLRNGKGWGTTCAAFVALFVLLQCLLLFAFSVRGINRLLLERAGLHLEVLPSARDQDIQELYGSLQALPSVEHVEYVPKEKAYEQERLSDPELVAFLEQYKLSNPFPDSFIVTLSGIDQYASFLTFIQQEKYRAILDPSFLTAVSNQQRDLHGILQLTSAFQAIAFAFAGLAAVVLFMMMAEYVSRSLAARGGEFFLQDVLGAPRLSLSSVLASEMVILTLVALLLATLLTAAAVVLLPLLVSSMGSDDVFIQLQTAVAPFLTFALPLTIVAEITALPLLAWVTASVGVGKALSRPS